MKSLIIQKKHPGFITDPAQVTQWIEKNLISKKNSFGNPRIKEGTYTVNPNGVVDVAGGVNMKRLDLEYIPIQFGVVTGNFWCDNNQLTSLLGSPSYVGGDFNCNNNKLSSLEGAPSSVDWSFWCNSNQLSSLAGAPSSVSGSFNCEDNQLTSIEGAPSEIGRFLHCGNNFLCMNEPYKIGADNPGYKTEDLELIAHRFQEKVKDHPNQVNICKSVLNRPDLVEMFIKYNVTEVTDLLSDDVKDISSVAMKGNHKLR